MHTWDHLEETFFRYVKYLNNPLGGWIGQLKFVYVPKMQGIQSKLSFMMVSQLTYLTNKQFKKVHHLKEFF